ncbi:MAG: hypothetical protein IJO19_05280, partial [Clostridia bacterium]|nr:hypothetical protein [Clostridia bacterium]
MGDNINYDVAAEIKRYRDVLKSADMDEKIRSAFSSAVDEMQAEQEQKSNIGAVFSQISKVYDSYKTGNADSKAGEYEQSFYCYHEAVAQKLQQVAEMLKNADMVHLTLRESEALAEGLNCLTHFVKNSVYAIGMTEKANIASVAYDMIKETQATNVLSDNKILELKNAAINTELNAERMFRRFAGYKNNSMWSQVADMLNDGQTQAEFIKQRLKDKYQPMLENENFKKAQQARSFKDKDLVDIGITDENGEAIKIPHSMMISVYLHLQNEQNQNHALNGGFEIPNLRKYYKGINQSKSFVEGKQKGKIVDVSATLRAIRENMTDYDKIVAKTVANIFDNYTKAEYNKVNLDVFGFEKAKVKHYFPINSSRDYIASDFNAISQESLKNQGNMKTRQQGAVNPIRLYDVFDVVENEINKCGDYCGKLKAEITFTRLWNTTTDNFGTNLKNEIGLHFGESGKKYVEHLMQDYSKTRKSEKSVILSKLRSNVATGALMANINVAMKQAGSYPTAAAVIGWKPLMKALATNDNGAVVFYKANRELIDKYTPWLRFRAEGY